MSDEITTSDTGCGCCGCITIILFWWILGWAIFAGISVGENTWKLNLWPPGLEKVKPIVEKVDNVKKVEVDATTQDSDKVN